MARLPVPRPLDETDDFRELARIARGLADTGIESAPGAYARLNAVAARLYGLSRADYAAVVASFPLLPQPLRDRCLGAALGEVR